MNAESPRVVGRYVVHAEIAAGGMATVHVGRLLGSASFARTVAIKRLHPHFAKDPEFVAMFLDEARLAARVRHPNVVPVLDVVAEGGELFLVMEYVEGESLARLVGASRKGGHAPPPHIAAAIVAQSLHGLHAAHEARDERGAPLDIVHRDMSPQNVLVGVDGVARVLDFGVAKAVGRAQNTREGELKGKLPYMAPEQIRRGGKSVSRRTDVYSAGVVLWEALTARRLFSGEDQGEILSAVIEGASDLPSSEEPGVPRILDEITMRALRRDPDERFQTAREMALAIEAAIGVVPPAELGAWTSRLAAESLADRARAVIEIESSPAIVTANATPLLEETATMQLAVVPMPEELDETDTDPTTTFQRLPPFPDPMDEIDNLATVPRKPTVVVSSNEPITEVNRRGPRRAVLVFALALFTAVAVFAILTLTRRPEAPIAPATATPQPRVTAVQSTSVVEPEQPPPPPPEELPPVEIPTTAQAAHASAPVPTATTTKKVPSITKPPPPAPKSTCNPPYYYEKGIKRFKPNCL